MWLIDSSVGRKFVMSITGVMLVLFLLFHSIMNFVVVISPEAYDAVSAALGANWYALIATMGLGAGFIIHILYALYLSYQNLKARGNVRYAVVSNQPDITWASKNMLILGGIILGFLVLHFVQFWSKMQLVELMHMNGAHLEPIMIDGQMINPADVASKGSFWVSHYFRQPLYAILYIVWLGVLWYHLTHGIWSMFQSMGMNNKNWMPRVKSIGNVVATIIILLFMTVPLYYLIA